MRPVTPSTIIAERLQLLKTLNSAGKSNTQQFTDVLAETAALAEGLEPYLDTNSTPNSPALEALVRATRMENWAERHESGATSLPLEGEMLSGHVEGQFLKMLVRATGALRVLDIGLFTGYSALAMAEGLPNDGALVALEIDEYAARFAQRHFAGVPHGAKIEIRVGPAGDTLADMKGTEPAFDFVFIDADKGGYANYLDMLLNGELLADNALVCVDNTLMQGKPYMSEQIDANGQAIADFNRKVSEDKRLEQVLLPIRDGITLIQRI